MCTSIVANGKKTIIGWNLDILDMEYRVVAENDKVYIAVMDAKEGWMPLFGANSSGNFVAMPTCWPFDARSNPADADSRNIILLDIDLLLGNKTFGVIREIAGNEPIFCVPGITFEIAGGEKDIAVYLIANENAVPFYEKIGMKKADDVMQYNKIDWTEFTVE